MQIVKAKLAGQAATLGKLGDETGERRLLKTVNEVKTGDTSNSEGQAARYYWDRVFARVEADSGSESGEIADDWHRDQDGLDVYNSALNYAYTILRGHAIRGLLSAGLSPTLGVFHKNRSNFFCLADDLMEPFRPAVDYAITQLVPSEEALTPDVKGKLVEACNSQFLKSGLTIPSVLTDFAQAYGRYVEGDLAVLEVPQYEV
jgi:CRISPR-associated protein Cas1